MEINPFYIYFYHVSSYLHPFLDSIILLCKVVFGIITFAILFTDDAKHSKYDRLIVSHISKYTIGIGIVCYFIETLFPTPNDIKNMVLTSVISNMDLSKIQETKNIIDVMF